MNWFSVAALSSRSLVNCIGLCALSISITTCMGISVETCCALSSMAARCPTTSFLQNSGEEFDRRTEAHTRRPTGFPPPALSRSLVESDTTVVPRLYSAFASPISSSSRSPCKPSGGGDCDERGESGAGEDCWAGAITMTRSKVYFGLFTQLICFTPCSS